MACDNMFEIIATLLATTAATKGNCMVFFLSKDFSQLSLPADVRLMTIVDLQSGTKASPIMQIRRSWCVNEQM